MTPNERAVVITFIFLLLWWYGLVIFEDFSVPVPFIEATFTFQDYSKYFVFLGLASGFFLFLLLRREERKEDVGKSYEQPE